MKLVTAPQMQMIDRAAIERCGIASLDLMERAGGAVANAIKKHFPKKGEVIVVVGKGNNGGDGLVAARHLKKAGYDISLYLLSSWTEFSPDARTNWDLLADLGINVHEITSESELKNHTKKFEHAICIIDAIFGTGLASDVLGTHKAVIDFINSFFRPVVSVDMPSGLSSETGQPLGSAVRAKYTVTFGLPKLGLVTGLGPEYAKEIEVADIGFPKELIDGIKTGYYLVTPDMFSGFFGPRPSDSHKGDFGHVLVIAGSTGKMGAGLLAARAALRSGAGLVTYAMPEAAFAKFDTKSPEVMYEGLPDKKGGFLTNDSLAALKKAVQNKDVIAIGPGIGTNAETKTVVAEILKKSVVPVVVDADALNCLAGNMDIISNKKTPLILTPHPGELSRLTGQDIKKIQLERVSLAKSFATAHRVYLVLKGHHTVIASPDGEIFINPTGGPGMATAGMGDVLTGIIASFIAQKLPIKEAIVAGVYLHGLAGDMASEELGERGLLASDIINNLPKVIKLIATVK